MKPFRFLTSASGVITLFVMMFGLFAGVALVQQEQELRERADEVREHKVALCHKTGSDTNQWTQIEVSDNAQAAHLEHGDIQGNCPTQTTGPGGEKDKDKDKDGESQTGGGGTGGTSVSLASSVTVANEIVRVETKYVYVTTRVDFQIKFQGLNDKKPDKSVRLMFRRGEEELHVYNNVLVKANDKGIYRGTLTDVRPGTYEVFVKSDGYLQRKFESVVLKQGTNSYNWTSRVLLAGDFNGDNVLDAADLGEFSSFYTESLNPTRDETNVFDLDMNDRLEVEDLELVLANYKDLKVEGEN